MTLITVANAADGRTARHRPASQPRWDKSALACLAWSFARPFAACSTYQGGGNRTSPFGQA